MDRWLGEGCAVSQIRNAINLAARILDVALANDLVPKNYAALVRYILLGLRNGELLGLRWISIDYENMLFTIDQRVRELADRCKLVSPNKAMADQMRPAILVAKRRYLDESVRKAGNS